MLLESIYNLESSIEYITLIEAYNTLYESFDLPSYTSINLSDIEDDNDLDNMILTFKTKKGNRVDCRINETSENIYEVSFLVNDKYNTTYSGDIRAMFGALAVIADYFTKLDEPPKVITFIAYQDDDEEIAQLKNQFAKLEPIKELLTKIQEYAMENSIKVPGLNATFSLLNDEENYVRMSGTSILKRMSDTFHETFNNQKLCQSYDKLLSDLVNNNEVNRRKEIYTDYIKKINPNAKIDFNQNYIRVTFPNQR